MAAWIDRQGTRIVLTDANEAVEVFLPAGWDAPRCWPINEGHMKELILDGGEQLDGQSRLLKLNDTPGGECVTISAANVGIVAVLDRNQQRELVAYLSKRLWPI